MWSSFVFSAGGNQVTVAMQMTPRETRRFLALATSISGLAFVLVAVVNLVDDRLPFAIFCVVLAVFWRYWLCSVRCAYDASGMAVLQADHRSVPVRKASALAVASCANFASGGANSEADPDGSDQYEASDEANKEPGIGVRPSAAEMTPPITRSASGITAASVKNGRMSHFGRSRASDDFAKPRDVPLPRFSQ
jgi:hypothetical protein